MRRSTLALPVVIVSLALSACTFLTPTVQVTGEDEIRDIVRQELAAALADVKSGLQGEPGPAPTDEDLLVLINEVITGRLEDIRGPAGEVGAQGIQGSQGEPGLQGEQGLQGGQGLQGEPGTAGQSSGSTFETRISSLEVMIGTLDARWSTGDIEHLFNELDEIQADLDQLFASQTF